MMETVETNLLSRDYDDVSVTRHDNRISLLSSFPDMYIRIWEYATMLEYLIKLPSNENHISPSLISQPVIMQMIFMQHIMKEGRILPDYGSLLLDLRKMSLERWL